MANSTIKLSPFASSSAWAASQDLNGYTRTGIYAISSIASPSDFVSHSYGLLFVLSPRNNQDTVEQFWFDRLGIYHREYRSEAWGTFTKFSMGGYVTSLFSRLCALLGGARHEYECNQRTYDVLQDCVNELWHHGNDYFPRWDQQENRNCNHLKRKPTSLRCSKRMRGLGWKYPRCNEHGRCNNVVALVFQLVFGNSIFGVSRRGYYDLTVKGVAA